jgi:hypothetical protein
MPHHGKIALHYGLIRHGSLCHVGNPLFQLLDEGTIISRNLTVYSQKLYKIAVVSGQSA